MQGGVALGVFDVGVFKTLYNKLTEEDKLNGETNRPLFDVVIGTSIGAINAAILVGYAKQKGSWDGSHQYLERFWRERLTSPTPTSAKWWQFYGTEAGRRYYSAKQSPQDNKEYLPFY